jgi:hypothetical protein
VIIVCVDKVLVGVWSPSEMQTDGTQS